MEKFTTLSVSVTEEIEPSKVLTFIRTQIGLKNLLITDESYFYFRFLPQTLSYEIILFQELKDIYSSGIFSFSHQSLDETSITLFITSHFFTMYQNKELLLAKKISDTSIEDIESYIEQTYRIKAEKTVFIDENKLKEFIENTPQAKLLKQLHKVIPNNSFQYFLTYLGIGFFIFILFLYHNYDLGTFNNTKSFDVKNNILSKEVIVYKKHTNNNSTKTLMVFLKFIKKQNIEVKTIEYLGNHLTIKLISSDKKKLLELLDDSQIRLVLKSIQQDNNLNQYIMEVILHG